MEVRHMTSGDILIKVDSGTSVKVKRHSDHTDMNGIVFRQDIGELERVYLSVAELREVLRIIDEQM